MHCLQYSLVVACSEKRPSWASKQLRMRKLSTWTSTLCRTLTHRTCLSTWQPLILVIKLLTFGFHCKSKVSQLFPSNALIVPRVKSTVPSQLENMTTVRTHALAETRMSSTWMAPILTTPRFSRCNDQASYEVMFSNSLL